MGRRKGFYQEEQPDEQQARMKMHEVLFTAKVGDVVPQHWGVGKPVDIPIERLLPNPFQARQHFDDLEELIKTIREQGFITRLRVRPHPQQEGFFELVFGERRLRAAKALGYTQLPCEIAQHTDEDLIEMGLAENLQRKDLSPLEEAEAFRRFKMLGYSIRDMAERFGKDKNYIDNRLALLRTPEDVQDMVLQRPDTISAAREISKLSNPEERAQLIDGLLQGELNAADVRDTVRWRIYSREKRQRQRLNEPEPFRLQLISVTVERDIAAFKRICSRWRRLDPQSEHDQTLLLEGITKLVEELTRLQSDYVKGLEQTEVAPEEEVGE